MEKLTDKRKCRQLILLCAVAYFVSYLTRLNYAAVVAEFIAESGLPKATAVLPVTALSITYGVGQLISGYLGDRIRPRHIMTGGFAITTVMNLLMPLAAPDIMLMTVVWACNGFAQAMMWPPMVKIMTTALDKETYNRATPRFLRFVLRYDRCLPCRAAVRDAFLRLAHDLLLLQCLLACPHFRLEYRHESL